MDKLIYIDAWIILVSLNIFLIESLLKILKLNEFTLLNASGYLVQQLYLIE